MTTPTRLPLMLDEDMLAVLHERGVTDEEIARLQGPKERGGQDPDDHYYGAWSGGSKKEGGGPAGSGGQEAASPASKLRAALDKAERRIAGLRGGEILVSFDKDGKEVFSKMQMGDPDGPGPLVAGVDFTPDEVHAMAGMVVTHNHPGAWDYPEGDPRRDGSSFSGADVALAAEANVAEIRAVTPHWVYSLRPGSGGWGSRDAAYYMYQEISGGVRSEFRERISKLYKPWGKTFDEQVAHAEREHSHTVLARLAAVQGWVYTAVER